MHTDGCTGCGGPTSDDPLAAGGLHWRKEWTAAVGRDPNSVASALVRHRWGEYRGRLASVDDVLFGIGE